MDDWPLIGRGALLDSVLPALAGDPPGAVVITGPAGVGKTRVLREITRDAAARGWTAIGVVGTRAAATVPFGAFAGLLRDGADASPPAVLSAVRSKVAPRSARPVVLAVDDAQRLDPPSAMVVHHLAHERTCPIVATVRGGEPVPDAIENLWKDGFAVRIELEPLTRAEVQSLLAAALGGTVDGATVRRLWTRTRGNPLFLRELVTGARAANALRVEDGVWRLRDVTLPRRLAELIGRRLADVDDAARAALDALAVAERIDLEELDGLAALDVVERLERDGVVEIVDDGGRAVATLAHPLYAEAVRATMPVIRRRRVCAALAARVAERDDESPADLVRAALWRLDAGEAVDADLVARAARAAFVANDLALAERLAAAAREAGAGFDAGLVAAEVALLQGRGDDALARFTALEPEASTDQERVLVANARAHVLAMQLGQEDDAIAVLEGALSTLDDPDQIDVVRSRLAIIHAQAPRPSAAVAAARPILARRSSPMYHQATYATSLALAVSGAGDEAVRVGERGYAVHRTLTDVVRAGPETQLIGPVLGHLAAGRLSLAADTAARGYEEAVASRDEESHATFALLRGLVATAEGRLSAAGAAFREAAGVNRALNDVMALRWSLGGVALAAGLRGDREESARASTELTALDAPAMEILEPDLVARGRAWSHVAAGERTLAVGLLRDAAERARRAGAFVAEMTLRHDLARLGDARDARERLATLAGIVDGELAELLAEHAGAMAASSGPRLEEVAIALAELGAALLASEAASGAAEALRAEGYLRRATACEALVAELITRCEGARSPLVVPVPPRATLTLREREIASLAALGLSNRDIAARLHLSARTIENHLARVYTKLGIRSRSELRGALERNRMA